MEIKEILRETYLKYGDTLFLDNKKLIGNIRDLLSDYPSEVKKIALIINENIVSKIIKEVDANTIERNMIYAQMLVDNYSMDYEVARRFIGYFIYATKGIDCVQNTGKYPKASNTDQAAKDKLKTPCSNAMDIAMQKEDISYDSGYAELPIEIVFSIFGRGVVIAGKISKGKISIGDELTIGYRKCVVSAIEKNGKLIENATHEDGEIGLLIKNIKKADVKIGMVAKKKYMKF